ncbi:MAG: O-phospho-L-seryl-tRNA:Cys-tRNA synthase [Promethearchaeota archaeon]
MKITEGELRKFRNLERETQEGYINLQPIQRGGVMPPESKKVLLSFGDGYSMCDYCFTGRLDEIEKPGVAEFLRLFAKFVGMDVSMPTSSSREGMRLIIQQLALRASRASPGANLALVIDGLAHYSTFLAAEAAGVEVFEVPHDGYPTFKIDVPAYGKKIDELRDANKEVIGALLTHADYLYGNVVPPKDVGAICNKKGVPFIVNGAYTVGIMPFDGRECNADFVTASGHKSMASSGPIGMVSCKEEYRELLFPTSKTRGEWSGRSFPRKISTLLGCPAVYGAPLATLMSSLPHVVERTQPGNWKRELENAKILSDMLQGIEGVKQLGKIPHEHTLVQYETPSFQEAAKNANKKGFFLYNELKSRGIIGIYPGMVKAIKLNTFGLKREQVIHVGKSFIEIAKKYKIHVDF